mgnify:CR=1 FL=1
MVIWTSRRRSRCFPPSKPRAKLCDLGPELGEEFGEQPGTSGFRWILDPIDGTGLLIRGYPGALSLVGVAPLNRDSGARRGLADHQHYGARL